MLKCAFQCWLKVVLWEFLSISAWTHYAACGSDTALTCNAQWSKTYGGTNDDGAQALVQTSDGGYAVAGPTGSFALATVIFGLLRLMLSMVWLESTPRLTLSRYTEEQQMPTGTLSVFKSGNASKSKQTLHPFSFF